MPPFHSYLGTWSSKVNNEAQIPDLYIKMTYQHETLLVYILCVGGTGLLCFCLCRHNFFICPSAQLSVHLSTYECVILLKQTVPWNSSSSAALVLHCRDLKPETMKFIFYVLFSIHFCSMLMEGESLQGLWISTLCDHLLITIHIGMCMRTYVCTYLHTYIFILAHTLTDINTHIYISITSVDLCHSLW